jgi:tetratricopeptide (TPR) repeat protein
LEEALSGFRETLGAEHPETLAHIGSVGYAYWKQKRLDRSVPLFEETFALCQKVFGSDHQFTLATMADLGKNYTDDGQVDRAVRLLEDALGRCRATLQPGHRLRLVSHYNLAGAYVANGQVDQAISLLEEELGLNREAHRADAAVVDDHAVVLWFYAMRLLGDLRFQRGDFTVAEPLLREAYEGLAKRQSQAREPEEAKTMFAAATNLLALYEKTHQPDKAVALVRELLVPLRQALPPDSTDLADRLAQFSLPLLQLGAHADAEPLLRECLAIRENAAPDDWRTFNTKSMLGGSLLGEAKQSQVTDAASATAKRAEAEPLLVQGYEGMQQGEATIPPEGKIRLTEALQRLVDLCTALAKPDEAAKWQEKLDALTSDAKPGNTEHEPD